MWFKSCYHSGGLWFGIAFDQDFGFAERDLGDLPVGVAFVLVVCLQAVDELRRLGASTAGFIVTCLYYFGSSFLPPSSPSASR